MPTLASLLLAFSSIAALTSSSRGDERWTRDALAGELENWAGDVEGAPYAKYNLYPYEVTNLTIWSGKKEGVRWVPGIVAEAMADWVPTGQSTGDPCTKHGQIYSDALSNLTYWATKMYDAGSGRVAGVLEGKNFDLGHFDECISAWNPEEGIRGKYLVARLDFRPAEGYPSWKDLPRVYRLPAYHQPAWEAVKPSLDPRISPRNSLNWAVCVPSSCSDEDVRLSLEQKLQASLRENRIEGNISILSAFSYSREGKSEEPFGKYVFMGITSFILVMIIISTLYNVIIDPDSDEKNWFYDFSVQKNWNQLTRQSRNEFSVMSGMKSLSMFMIIYGHRMMMSVSSPQFNPNTFQLASGKLFPLMIENGTLVVNTFITITGFFTFNKIYGDIKKGKDINACKNICQRFLRLTPAYLFVMCFQYYMFPRMEGGPMSRSVVWNPSHFGSYWWTHLLYINNYVKPEYQCLIPSWYLAMDLQLYIIAYLIGTYLQKKPKWIPHILTLLCVVFLIIPSTTVGVAKFWGTYKIYYRTLHEYFRDPEFMYLYLPTHTRGSPYFIGMLGAYIYHECKSNNASVSNKTFWLLAIVTHILMHVSLIGCWPMFIPGRDYVLWENMVYASFHRFGWALSVCWVIIGTLIGKPKIYKSLIGWPVYEFFNKLNYSALIIHTLVQIFMNSYIRSPINYGWITGVWMACGDIVFTYSLSVILYIIIEAPFASLSQKLWDSSPVEKCSEEKPQKN